MDDKLFLYQQKTGTPVYCPLPQDVVTKLNAVANDNDRYFFYDGSSERESMVKSWDRVFKKVGQAAVPPVANCHPHRFRDTFAASLLLKGVSLDSVSKLLGHNSIKITERRFPDAVSLFRKGVDLSHLSIQGHTSIKITSLILPPLPKFLRGWNMLIRRHCFSALSAATADRATGLSTVFSVHVSFSLMSAVDGTPNWSRRHVGAGWGTGIVSP